MRLWHEKLLPHLSKQWLLGQHRECCALRGKAWGKKHNAVDYVFKLPMFCLYRYHIKVMKQLEVMGVNIDIKWRTHHRYRGKVIGMDFSIITDPYYGPSYPEHDNEYFKECVENLLLKQSQSKKPFRKNAYENPKHTLINEKIR